MLMIFINSIKLFESISYVCACLGNAGAQVIVMIMLNLTVRYRRKRTNPTYSSALNIKRPILRQTRVCVTHCGDDGCVSI